MKSYKTDTDVSTNNLEDVQVCGVDRILYDNIYEFCASDPPRDFLLCLEGDNICDADAITDNCCYAACLKDFETSYTPRCHATTFVYYAIKEEWCKAKCDSISDVCKKKVCNTLVPVCLESDLVTFCNKNSCCLKRCDLNNEDVQLTKCQTDFSPWNEFTAGDSCVDFCASDEDGTIDTNFVDCFNSVPVMVNCSNPECLILECLN